MSSPVISAPRSFTSAWPRAAAALVMFSAYLVSGVRFGATGMSPKLAVLAVCAGVVGAFALHAGWVFWFGARCGVHPHAVVLGLGPAWRSRVHGDRLTILRRVPLPLLRVVPAFRSGPGLSLRLRLWATTLLAAALAAAALLVGTGSGFGLGAGLSLGGVSVLLVAAQTGRLLLRPLSPEELDRRGRLAGSPLQTAAAHLLAGRVADARQTLDAWQRPSGEPGTDEQILRARILLLEGRYREAAADARALAEVPRLPRRTLALTRTTEARALAYAIEQGDAGDGSAERLLAVMRELRDAPGSVMSGTDLKALYYLAKGNRQDALYEARSTARIGGAPAERCLALCTLAIALHRSGHLADARQTAVSARVLAPEVARVITVERLVLADAP
ncbi:hypothetical protein [Peterkaempfera sp. SMS 1(5)a]|uniref:hypothetical protein n=1 Tax=Peterkaempfera podocarpi TaxID=3232308 RepID=UPI00366B422C